MAQLLAVGIIVFGLVVIAFAIFITSREQKKTVSLISTQKPEQHATPPSPEAIVLPVSQQPQAEKQEVTENVVAAMRPDVSSLRVYAEAQSVTWWREQISSLTGQLRYLREHAKDVERQIEILSEIATLATELEMLQRKRDISLESKISLFPLQVHRQPTDVSYVTDKRPAVRKYKIEAMS